MTPLAEVKQEQPWMYEGVNSVHDQSYLTPMEDDDLTEEEIRMVFEDQAEVIPLCPMGAAAAKDLIRASRRANKLWREK